ncbi:MAG: hypothetical protein SGI99_11470 [Pseudomonadota bacterium]|nr:hypothetical protein [Pseudomonadota bacterium]
MRRFPNYVAPPTLRRENGIARVIVPPVDARLPAFLGQGLFYLFRAKLLSRYLPTRSESADVR